MQKWEYFRLVISSDKDGKWSIKYKDQNISYEQISSALNELGNQGWELATSTPFAT